MLQRYVLFFQPVPVTVTVLFAVLMFGIGEMLAENVATSPAFHADAEHGVALPLRSLALPNYWVWYEPEAIRSAFVAQKRNIFSMMVSIVFNAAVNTPAVMVALVMLTLLVALRVFPPGHGWLWIWLLPVAAFVFDLLEDLALLVLALGFPLNMPPLLMEWLPRLSFIKYLLWLLNAIFIMVCTAVLLLRGPARPKTEGKS